MGSKQPFAKCCANKHWRASLSQHRMKPILAGLRMLIRYLGSWHFVAVPRHRKGELAAFTTLHLGILHQIQPCFLQKVPQLSATCKRRDLARRCRLWSRGSCFVLKMSVLPLRLRSLKEGALQVYPYTCTSHGHAPTYPLLCSAMDCSCAEITTGGELKGRVERKRRKVTNKAINVQ